MNWFLSGTVFIISKAGKLDGSIMVGDFDTTLSIMVKTIAKNNEDIEDFKSTRKWLDLTHNSRCHSTWAEHILKSA